MDAKLCPRCGKEALTFKKAENLLLCSECGYQVGLQQ